MSVPRQSEPACPNPDCDGWDDEHTQSFFLGLPVIGCPSVKDGRMFFAPTSRKEGAPWTKVKP